MPDNIDSNEYWQACCKTWTGFVKDGFVKGRFVKHGFVKGRFVKHGFVKHGLITEKNQSLEKQMSHLASYFTRLYILKSFLLAFFADEIYPSFLETRCFICISKPDPRKRKTDRSLILYQKCMITLV